MLRRRSIRTKMFAGLFLLTSAVCLLAFSGFWGLYSYRGLAHSVSDAAHEIELASGLHREAVTLYANYPWFQEADRPFELIGSSNLSDSDVFERRNFDMTLSSLGTRLSTYTSELENASATDRLLPELSRRRQSLEEVTNAYGLVRILSMKPRNESRDRTMSDELRQLTETAKRHSEAIQESMAAFSQDVSGQYRTKIILAWFCLVASLGLIAMLLWLFWTSMIQPFRTLLEGSRMVGSQSVFGHHITLGTEDELEELAQAMNAMSSRFLDAYKKSENLRENLEQQVRDRTREVIRNEQLASVGFLAAGVAHEINNPLTTIAWGAESLESQVAELNDDDGVQRDTIEMLTSTLKQIQSEAFRCKGITDRLLDFSRMSEPRRESTDLVGLVTDVVGLVSKVGEYRCKEIHTHSDGAVFAQVNADQIRQVVLNLITNALESVDEKGRVDVSIRNEDQQAKIIVQDDGCGMTDEVMTHLFEPFFTRRRNGQGTGLGLSITCRIVSQHGGSLTPFSDGDGRGSRMEVALPLNLESTATMDDSGVYPKQRLIAA